MFLDRPVSNYSKEERSERADQARRLLSDPFFMGIMEEIEADAISAWLQYKDPQAREACWLTAKGLDGVVVRLRGVVEEAIDPPEEES